MKANDKNMEYPIPTHLKHLLKVDMSKSDSNYLSGSIVCECGCDRFSIQHNENRKYDPQIPFDEQDGLKVIVNCKECEKEYVLFDESKHGFNGFVNEDCRTASNDSLKELSCKTCGSRYFFVNVGIEAEDKNQFVEECVNEFPERFTAEDYVDSFDWITITLCCANCNESVDWIDLELS